MSAHELFRWRWHHFRAHMEPKVYLPILAVLGEHEGRGIKEARDDVDAAVEKLNLSVGLGNRRGGPNLDILRNRSDIWRFTGSLEEPGLADEEIRLTALGHALVDDPALFEPAMRRQALRLRFPQIPRLRYAAQLPEKVEELSQAVAEGPGVNVARAWSLASAVMRAAGSPGGLNGNEAAKFLSGARSLDEIPARAEKLLSERSGMLVELPEPSEHERRQSREIEQWLSANGVLAEAAPTFADDPRDREFAFRNGSVEEMRRWADWWGSAPR